MLNPRAITLVVMIVAAAASRFVPSEIRPWNFTALGAMCLFGGAYFQKKWLAFVVPMAALAISDPVFSRHDMAESLRVVWMSYLLFALTVVWGMTLRGQVTILRVGAVTVLSTAMFFVVSNFHAWLAGHSGQPLTSAGLLASYIQAIPFGRGMLLGNLFYGAILFGGYELLTRQWPVLKQSTLSLPAGA